jgi:hypothetical protein
MMKKVALSLAGLLAAAAFAPEASALPVFARQTGMACNACHFQHFPLLNSFGRSFKASGFTMMGAQAKVEGDMLSIPAEVNAAVLTSMGYEKSNAQRVAPLNQSAGGASTGSWFVAGEKGEASLFLGGRGSDFMGYLTEVTMGNGAAAVDSFKTPILADIPGGMKGGLVLFTTNGQGASYGFETMNTGANAIHSITNTVGFTGQYINAVSAQQYIGTGSHATGASLVATNEMGFINVTKFVGAGPDSGGAFVPLTSTYLRAAYTGDMGGMDLGVGVQNWRGTSLQAAPGVALVPVVNNLGVPVAPASFVAQNTVLATQMNTKATAVDFQLQNNTGMPWGVYITYAKAPKDTTGIGNVYNGGTLDRSSFNIAAEVGVVPEKTTVGVAFRQGKSGFDKGLLSGGAATSTNASDNAIFLTATYKLAQNLLTRFSYVKQSGDYWNTANGTTQALGSNSWTVNLYALF